MQVWEEVCDKERPVEAKGKSWTGTGCRISRGRTEKNGASREEWNETVQQEYEHKKAERPDRLVCAYFLASRDARGAHEQSHP